VVIVVYGLMGGSIAGYLSGVLVGGVFLVADALRGRFEGGSPTDSDETSPDGSE
jgi:hypothetical protein